MSSPCTKASLVTEASRVPRSPTSIGMCCPNPLLRRRRTRVRNIDGQSAEGQTTRGRVCGCDCLWTSRFVCGLKCSILSRRRRIADLANPSRGTRLGRNTVESLFCGRRGTFTADVSSSDASSFVVIVDRRNDSACIAVNAQRSFCSRNGSPMVDAYGDEERSGVFCLWNDRRLCVQARWASRLLCSATEALVGGWLRPLQRQGFVDKHAPPARVSRRFMPVPLSFAGPKQQQHIRPLSPIRGCDVGRAYSCEPGRSTVSCFSTVVPSAHLDDLDDHATQPVPKAGTGDLPHPRGEDNQLVVAMRSSGSNASAEDASAPVAADTALSPNSAHTSNIQALSAVIDNHPGVAVDVSVTSNGASIEFSIDPHGNDFSFEAVQHLLARAAGRDTPNMNTAIVAHAAASFAAQLTGGADLLSILTPTASASTTGCQCSVPSS
ncbi:hypothetical protein HMN09_00305800 [Mycena chlorophos]|uniref:Uncharacterized protein n=1 Tax=Mycena chlorophos TaxID=658473 RepID=A0A8H6WLZ6_MYCCL|nr:hypothetical protein HMN09_00305800 [Mycena chlorophos]